VKVKDCLLYKFTVFPSILEGVRRVLANLGVFVVCVHPKLLKHMEGVTFTAFNPANIVKVLIEHGSKISGKRIEDTCFGAFP